MSCPYIHGTQEYYLWWEFYFKRAIKSYLDKAKYQQTLKDSLEETKYGHDFGKDRICDCGMYYGEYYNVNSDERWRERNHFICRRKSN